MKTADLKPVLAAVLACRLCSGASVSPVIGTIQSAGDFRVNGSAIAGNSTLFDGARIETGDAASSLLLERGTHLLLSRHSSGRIFADRFRLDRGQIEVDAGPGFELTAYGLRFHSEAQEPSVRARIAETSQVGPGKIAQNQIAQNQIEVAALSGTLEVRNSAGLIVAQLKPGMSLAFAPQANLESTRVAGTLEFKAGHFLLTDEITNVTVELAGPGLRSEVGKRIQVEGRMDPGASPVAEASQLVRVIRLERIPSSGTAAAGTNAPNRKVSAASATISGTTIAIIGGVAAAGVAGGLAASGELSGSGARRLSR